MARKAGNSFLEDVVERTARLPWWVGVVLAVATYLALHHLATREIALSTAARPRSEVLWTHVWTGIVRTGQYLLPLAFSIGAVVSLVTRYRRRRGFVHHPGAGSHAAAIPGCPKCNRPMVKITAKQGANAGKPFWGCSAFPECRGIRAIEPHGTS